MPPCDKAGTRMEVRNQSRHTDPKAESLELLQQVSGYVSLPKGARLQDVVSVSLVAAKLHYTR